MSHNIAELNEMYKNAESCDEEIFAEMRSNLLLVSGNHYSKRSSNSLFNHVRNSQKLSEAQKLRLTKNHIHKITRHYINAITSKVPGVAVAPQNDMDMQDKKSAELNQAVWEDAKNRYKLKEILRELYNNFVEIGEMCCFIYWEPAAGDLVGYENATDEQGQPIVDPMTGQPQPDKSRPKFSGGFEFKNIPGFNLLRAPQAKMMKSSPYHILREMVDAEELKTLYADAEDKLKFIGEGDDEAFIVFDTNHRQYRSEEKQVLIKYQFFKPSPVYPTGYFYIYTERGILEEGELPFGIYPIIWEGFDTYSTNPRAYSIVKVARPYQAEINRASSQAATHQITVGDDKILYQGGTKLAQGALLPGVRGITYQGMAPQILPGRSGEQFLPYIQGQISEMYSACMLEEINMEKDPGQMDAYTLLFRSASQKQKFAQYTEKVESFLKDFCFTFLDMARQYYPDEMTIQAVGKSEQINMPEFKTTGKLNYKIKVEEQAEDITSKLGRQLALNHLVQYAGNSLDPKQLALIAKDMPFLSTNSMVKRLSIDYDNADNDMLAMERGQQPFISPYAENKIYVDAITYRMKQADFGFLPPQVQKLYDEYLAIHEDQIKKKEEAAQAAKDGFIPISGTLITVGMHVDDPKSQSGTRQVRLPYDALLWLLKKLDAQGSSVSELEKMNGGAVADMYGGQQAQQQGGMDNQNRNMPIPPQPGLPHTSNTMQ
jgi:hypothetical protein